MCLVVAALDAHPGYALVVAANRDEFHARPAAPAAWGMEAPFTGILAGRDLQAGGTWLGVRRDGRFALVTNVRASGSNDPAARSRGELVPRVLNAGAHAAAALHDLVLAQDRYNGFNLLAGDATGALWMSNRRPGVRQLTGGIHGLSNAFIDTPWPKLLRTVDRVRAWAASGDTGTAPLFAALADRAVAPDAMLPATGIPLDRERLLSSPFIVSAAYGTRCSTVFTIDRAGRARFHERSFDANGNATTDSSEEFSLT
ncbi:MAG: NRDE family protein [Casimicrobiaceae bacterium]